VTVSRTRALQSMVSFYVSATNSISLGQVIKNEPTLTDRVTHTHTHTLKLACS